MILSTLAYGLLLLSGTGASPAPLSRRYATKEQHTIPRGWSLISSAPASHLISLHIGLKQSNQDKLEQHALEVSDPSHERYGQYLSADEVNDLIAPGAETVDFVYKWLAEHGITTGVLSSTKNTISVTLPVKKVEQLLQTKYSVFRRNDGAEIIRTPEWSLPAHLHEHIDLIQPTTSFFMPKGQMANIVANNGKTNSHGSIVQRQNSDDQDNSTTDSTPDPTADPTADSTPEPTTDSTTDPSPTPTSDPATNSTSSGQCDISQACNTTEMTLKCLRCLYGTVGYTPQVPDKNGIGIANFLNQTTNRTDLRLYLEKFRPEAVASADEFQIEIVADGFDKQNMTAGEIAAGMSIEGNLDGQIVAGISWPTSFKAWNTGGLGEFEPTLAQQTNTNEPYIDWLNYILAQQDLPQVISVSYGDYEQTISKAYAVKVCDGFKQLAVRGISVIFASGDFGVGHDGTCFSSTNSSKPEFLPMFPASCPWVTAVGGTQGSQPEIAVSQFGSGAGFSNYFGRPSYQNSSVSEYLNILEDMYDGLYNPNGRAYPDVAASASRFAVVNAGHVVPVDGTSAAAPTFAAIIALVNDALIASGRPHLGFLNQWLYKSGYKALTDITDGSSIGCDTAGFPATQGWDPVTGLGTPNFGKLVDVAFDKWVEIH